MCARHSTASPRSGPGCLSTRDTQVARVRAGRHPGKLRHAVCSATAIAKENNMTANAAFHRRPVGTLAAMLLAGATACTTAPVQGVVENLDPVTGTTVVVLSQPVELVTEQNRGPTRDPFAFTAPFEIDRMGDRSLYLWISTPQDNGVVQHVEILCDGQPLTLD